MSERENAQTPAGTGEDDDASDERPADWKMYTGEPVEDHGTPKRPQQMNVGRENMQGSGEWPDPDTPPVEDDT
jgi:hypothetical protein